MSLSITFTLLAMPSSRTAGEKTKSATKTLQKDETETVPAARKSSNAVRLLGVANMNGFWIDTCCIDKRSSAELSEAINSMFRWYQGAYECYVYLADVVISNDFEYEPEFRRSRWFTRGWTLQELIAPSHVIFLSRDWKVLDEKRLNEKDTNKRHEVRPPKKFIRNVAEITGIPLSVLNDGNTDLSAFSVAQRLSWLADRRTTRVEDIAYCMLGILRINMPLLYGEGTRAFKRLQVELISRYGDESIFACRDPVGQTRTINLLAPHARRFAGTAKICRASTHDRPSPVVSLNCAEFRMGSGRRGVFHHRQSRGRCILRLNCVYISGEMAGSPCIMFVHRAGCRPGHFVRTMATSDYIQSDVTCAYSENDVVNADDWVPVETDEAMFIHLNANDVTSCRGDLTNYIDISFRLTQNT